MASVSVIQKNYLKPDGSSMLYIRVTIQRRSIFHPVKVYWPKKNFDSDQGVVLPRWHDDKEASDVNLLIRQEIARIN